jgi:hypothetical protein
VPHSTEVGRIRYESEQRPLDCTADHDAAQFAQLRSRLAYPRPGGLAETTANSGNSVRKGVSYLLLVART